MKNLKNITALFLLGLATIGCTPNDPNGGGNPNPLENLLAIQSDATGNACNSWNLQNASSVTSVATSASFTNIRLADAISSPAGLLAQTTMTWQSSAYDNVNKKYAVALGETVVIYDLTSPTVPVPTTYVIAPSGSGSVNFIMAMEFVGGQLYVIQGNEIKKLTGGVLTSIGITVPAYGVTSDTMSNMCKNGTDIYFILKGELYTFDTTTTTLSSTSISGWISGNDYNGVEYYSGKIYATKRYSTTPFTTNDDFVSITFTGSESTLALTTPYTRDWSRVISAVDPLTGIYYLSSSNGFTSSTNTLTEINLNTGVNAVYTTTGFQFGLQYKD